jgi:hypothetical protein
VDSTNKQVFDSCSKDIVRSVVNGYHGAIFAYGQTAAGKTYTMQGKHLKESNCSMGWKCQASVHLQVTRGALAFLGRQFKKFSKQFLRFGCSHTHLCRLLCGIRIPCLVQSNNRAFLIRVSYLEVYNEKVHDLLAADSEKEPRIWTKNNVSCS